MISTRSVSYAKEVDDVMVLMVAVVKNRKNKEDLSKLMGDLMTAIVGIEQVDDELVANRLATVETIGYRMGDLVDAFLPPAVVPVVGK